MSRQQNSDKQKYLDHTFGDSDPLLDKIREEAQKEQVMGMQISPHEARLLSFLVQLSQAQKVVEIGTLYAYSGYHIAKTLPPGGQLWTLDHNQKRQDIAKNLLKDSPCFQKIEWLCGPALKSLELLESQSPFDMVFIDADKASYGKYLDWAEKHLKIGGLVVADNTFLFGALYGQAQKGTQNLEIMKEFNQRLAKSPCWQGALIPTQEGLSVGIKIKNPGPTGPV